MAGPAGQDGADGEDGKPGKDGERGKRGKAADLGSVPSDLGNADCAGRSVTVVVDVRIQGDRLQLDKQPVCIVAPASP